MGIYTISGNVEILDTEGGSSNESILIQSEDELYLTIMAFKNTKNQNLTEDDFEPVVKISIDYEDWDALCAYIDTVRKKNEKEWDAKQK